MKRLFLLAFLTLSVVLVAVFPGSTVQAATGSITYVCLSGSTLTVNISGTGSAGDIVGIQINTDPAVAVGTVGSSGPFSFTFTTTINTTSLITIQAGNLTTSGGPIGSGFGSATYYTPGSCPAAPVGYGNGGTTGIPAGFVQRGINCTVAVYSQVDGTPVGSNMVIKGQNWYVNPVPVRGKFRRLWTEIYVSGPVDGFIPTRCVLPYAFH